MKLLTIRFPAACGSAAPPASAGSGPCWPLSAALPGDASRAALADWPLGRRNRALAELRCACFGPRSAGWIACPQCGEKLEFEIDGRSLSRRTAGEPRSVRAHRCCQRADIPPAHQPRSGARRSRSRSRARGAPLLERCRTLGADSTIGIAGRARGAGRAHGAGRPDGRNPPSTCTVPHAAIEWNECRWISPPFSGPRSRRGPSVALRGPRAGVGLRLDRARNPRAQRAPPRATTSRWCAHEPAILQRIDRRAHKPARYRHIRCSDRCYSRCAHGRRWSLGKSRLSPRSRAEPEPPSRRAYRPLLRRADAAPNRAPTDHASKPPRQRVAADRTAPSHPSRARSDTPVASRPERRPRTLAPPDDAGAASETPRYPQRRRRTCRLDSSGGALIERSARWPARADVAVAARAILTPPPTRAPRAARPTAATIAPLSAQPHGARPGRRHRRSRTRSRSTSAASK